MASLILGISRVSPKHQVTIPKEVMQRFGFNTGDRIVFKEEDGKLVIAKG